MVVVAVLVLVLDSVEWADLQMLESLSLDRDTVWTLGEERLLSEPNCGSPARGVVVEGVTFSGPLG